MHGQPERKRSLPGNLDENGNPMRDPKGMVYDYNKARKVRILPRMALLLRYQVVPCFQVLMWNFSGRQNDIQRAINGYPQGKLVSGIPFIDNMRLGAG